MYKNIDSIVRCFIGDNFFFREGFETFSDSDSLLECGLIDSMGVLDLVLFLESTFSIRVADEDVVPENLGTIGGIVAYVQRKRALALSEVVTRAC
jgi:acyl carrier protein